MFRRVLFFIIIFSLGLGFGNHFPVKNKAVSLQNAEKNTPKAFISEVYDTIKENYWDNLSDAQLLELFKLSLEKNGGQLNVARLENKDQLLKAVSDSTKVAEVVGTILASLNPPGRSGLYTQKQEEQLKNTVNNVNPQKDLYKDMGVSQGASKEAVQQAYQKKSEDLTKDKSPQAQQKLKELSYAKDVLTKDDTKQRYDTNKVEPTIFTKIVNPGILYLQFKKFSPTSYDEFIKAFESYKDDSTLTTLIFDLRSNVGGAIDATAYFLGLFIGRNQNAFDFYHKGEYLPFKTPTDKLPSVTKYKQVVILIDNQTQSSAEMMVASLKRYHIGVVVGVPTKGWGTVERVFPLDNQLDKTNKYSLFLVHSITLRDDNLPIEGRGVEPDVNIKNTIWEQQLYSYFRNNQLIEAIKGLL